MEARRSEIALLALHAVRLQGMATVASAASRFRLDREAVAELFGDFEAYGWVRHAEFAGTGGWSLTNAGRVEGERRLREELDRTGSAGVVRDVHARFLPLNARFQSVVTRWQIRPLPGEELAVNDHTDVRWDDRVLADLVMIGRQLAPLCLVLTAALERFGGYDERYQYAAGAAQRGERQWVDGLSVDSCHRVWFQLHEDLLATLGLDRGAERASG